MKRVHLATAILLLTTIYFLFFHSETQDDVKACVGSTCIFLEKAVTSSEQRTGLMFRERLEGDRGMFFIFEDYAVHSFWMKNTLIPLDIIWLDENYTVIGYVTANPCTSDPCEVYSMSYPSKYVIEANAGFMEENDIGVGDRFRIN
ncbi:MAG: DUF192 domain-containing protein [Candidatus Altiarchaeota archaeon]|nr:DUF192 domain-containing protein [Candidatus Altiarchaeota archaeon]